MTRLRVATVQVVSENGTPAANLDRAERFVAEAADRSAELVLCPEFLAAGYAYEESIWDAGEPARWTDGVLAPTVAPVARGDR